jgi:Ca2+/H+ antiporter
MSRWSIWLSLAALVVAVPTVEVVAEQVATVLRSLLNHREAVRLQKHR